MFGPQLDTSIVLNPAPALDAPTAPAMIFTAATRVDEGSRGLRGGGPHRALQRADNKAKGDVRVLMVMLRFAGGRQADLTPAA